MQIRLTEIRLRGNDKKVRLDRDLDLASLVIGRGADNDLLLKGLTVALHHATLRKSDGVLYIDAASGKEVNVNGLVTATARLSVGDRIRIGSWELRILEPEPGLDLAIEYEEVERAAKESDALKLRTRTGLERGLLARRPLSWIAIVGVLAAFLALPLLWPAAQSPWNTGPVSRGHTYVENDCQSCHSGFFQRVANADCMNCHHDIGRHAPADLVMPELDNADCATCHLEHRGRDVDLSNFGSGFCSGCHADLASEIPTTSLRNASDFGKDHPPFKLALITDPEAEAESVYVTPDLVEVSGLKFNHLRHVGQAVTGRGDAKQFLQCGACHQPDAGGYYMRPIEFESHCQDCHKLDFGKGAVAGLVDHGDPAKIRAQLRGFYATRVLNGEVQDAAAPRRLRLRRPGTRLSPEEAELSRRWVESKVESANQRFFERPGTCVTCHTVVRDGSSESGVGIAPVKIQSRWVPGSIFSHDSHAPFACVKCHPAAGVYDPEEDTNLERPAWSLPDAIPFELIAREASTPVSESSGDVLIPAIETCRECHAGANATGGDTVPSPCSMCHPFHIRELGPMQRDKSATPAAHSNLLDGMKPGAGDAKDEEEAKVAGDDATGDDE